MEDRNKNIAKAVFFLIIAIGCGIVQVMGVSGRGKHYPIIGVVLGLFLAIGYLKKAFDKY